MSIKVDFNTSAFFSISSKPDSEWQRIIEKLWKVYGVRSTGSKSLDKAKLHELEQKDLEQKGTVSTGYITLSKAEQEKILEKKKNKNIPIEQKSQVQTSGAQALGEQIFLAIKMKNEQDSIDNKRKRNNRYQT